MQAIEPGWATRFYGMAVSSEVAAAANDHLTDRSITDLVDAHLAINQAYFGGLDKTLSGFVILDDEGDDYTLLDLRDSGQVWWQDHETREVSLRFNSLADMSANRAAKEPRHHRRVTTPALCDRYQWLVWLLARPLLQDGKPTQSTDYLVRNGIGRFRYSFPRPEALDEAFTAELPELADDPHLAIYWLLHTTVLADHERRQRVLIAVGASNHPLLRAFISRLGQLPLAGDLPVVPDFRARRALAQTYGAFELAPEQVPAACLRALELAPHTQSIGHGLQIVVGLDRGTIDDATVKATLARIPETTPGTALVAAVLEKRAKQGSSSHADVLARLLSSSDDPWWAQLEALWHVHELAYDGPALVTATRRILVHDRYHRRALQMAMRAAQIANEPIEAIYADLGIADALLGPYTKLVEHPDDWEAIVGSLPLPHLRRALAWRVLQRVELNRPSPALAAWAAGQVVGSNEPNRVDLVGEALAKLDPQTQTQVIETAAATIDSASHPLVAVLLAFLDGPDAEAHDYAAQFQLKRGKEAAMRALAPWVHDRELFDRLLRIVERPGSGSFVDLFFGKLFSPFEKDSYVLPKLDAAQATRVAKAMIKTQLRHPNIHARNSAGHQLFRFNHPGAESVLIDVLTEYAVRYAAIKGPGGAVLDHGKTENDQLEDVVANLYSAVRNLRTPAARTALVERLFAERRSYWRMGNALGEIWDPALHAQIMALLAERRDARAAGCYAFALHDFVKQRTPLVDLTRLIIEWQGDNEITRGFLHYALIVGMLAALDARDYDLVRRAHDAASWIADPPLEPDDHVRGRTWTNPLEDDAVKARVADVLSGAAEQAKQKLVTALADARAKGKPSPKISHDELGQLSGTVVIHSLLHDGKTGEVWFVDGEAGMRYFDGYGVVDPPARCRPVGNDGARAELENAFVIDDRALWWDKRAEHFRDVMQLGAHVLLAWGVNNGALQRYVLTFADVAGATRFIAQLRANPPKGFSEGDPYYVAGKGAVVRTYYATSDAGARERHLLWLLDTSVGDDDQGSVERAVAEHARREIMWLRSGGVMTTLEHMDNRRRAEDMTVREWITSRIRSDRRDPVWHLEALADIAAYLDDHGLTPRGFKVELAPPANDVELAALTAARTHPIPESLRTLWNKHASASWQLGKRGMRLLSPRHVLEQRPVAREAGQGYLQKLPREVAEQSAALFGALDVLVETIAGEPVTFIADVAREDGRVFSHAADHPNDFWWEVALGWMLATRMLADLDEALADAVPAIDTLRYGERAKRKAASKATSNVKPTKAAAKKAAAKKAAANQAPAKKTPAKKTPAKKTPAKPPKKPTVKPQPVAKARPTAANSAAEAKANPAAEAKAKPAAKAKAKPAAKANTQPAGKAKTQPGGKAKTQPAGKAKTQPAGTAKTKPAGKAKTKPVTKTKPAAKAKTKPTRSR